MKRAESNLELWGRKWPLEAFKIAQEEWSPAPKFNPSFHWPKDPVPKGLQTFYIYGLGNGDSYLGLKSWLASHPETHLHLISDNLSEMQAFFQWDLAEEVLKNPQVSLAYMPEGVNEKTILDKLYWQTPNTVFSIAEAPGLKQEQQKRYADLRESLSYNALLKNTLAQEYLQYGVPFFRNFYANLPQLLNSHLGTDLFGKFQGVPAVICGAGPSLEKSIPQLQNMKDKALIFAGGSALNALLTHGVKPHFGAGIDPNAEQAERLKATKNEEIPFFYRLRLFPEALKLVKGKKLYIPGAGGYDIAEWFEEKLGIEPIELDEGHNVVNFCTEIALKMGCNPIYFVGLDLAFTDNRLYAGGVDDKENTIDHRIERTDIYGKKTVTCWKWVAESEWLSAYAKEHPETRFLNATGGGLGMDGIPNVSLEELKSAETIALNLEIARPLSKDQEKLQEAISLLKASLKNCVEWIEGLILEIRKEMESPNPRDKPSSREALIFEMDLFDEPGYQAVLDIFHHLFARLQNHQAARLKELYPEESKQLNLGLLKLQDERLQFLKEVALANLLLLPSSPQ